MTARAAFVVALALAGMLLDDASRAWLVGALAVAGVAYVAGNTVAAVRLWRAERARNKRRARSDPTTAPTPSRRSPRRLSVAPGASRCPASRGRRR